MYMELAIFGALFTHNWKFLDSVIAENKLDESIPGTETIGPTLYELLTNEEKKINYIILF